MKPESKYRVIYVIVDYLAVNIGWAVFNVIRFFLLSLQKSQGYVSLSDYLRTDPVWLGQLIVPAGMLVIFYLSGYYNRVFVKSRAQMVMDTLASILIATLIAFFVMLVNDLTSDRLLDYKLVLVLFCVLFTVVFIPRWILTRHVMSRVESGIISFPTVVVGNYQSGDEIAARLKALQGNRGFNIIGYVNACEQPVELSGMLVFTMDDIEDVCDRYAVENIVLLTDDRNPACNPQNQLMGLVNRLFPLNRPIYVVPSPTHFLTSRVRQTDVRSEPLIDISRSDMPESTVNLKRVSDVIVSAIVLILISPLLAVLAIMVRLDSPGSAFYRQQRVGRHKKPFYICKLRTMFTDAESKGPALSSENDPRVTKIGRVLRKYRLDELPQFWNVLKGDMSLVGPRPEREYFMTQIVEKAPYYVLLLQVRPGITSWGMVKYGYADNVDAMIERSRYDLLYLENISFPVDMKILFHTVNTVVKGKGV